MESYIDFIKKYNNEKSVSSSTDTEFDDFLKGGANKFKGGFPQVFSIEGHSDSFRQFSPNLNINKILNNEKKEPFLNVSSQDNVNGGFLNLFKSPESTSLHATHSGRDHE